LEVVKTKAKPQILWRELLVDIEKETYKSGFRVPE
jgi:hypothetical protein